MTDQEPDSVQKRIVGEPINFTFSAAAIAQLQVLKAHLEQERPGFELGSLDVSWGRTYAANGKLESGSIMIGLRSKADVAALFAQGAEDPEIFGGVPVFFYITPRDS